MNIFHEFLFQYEINLLIIHYKIRNKEKMAKTVETRQSRKPLFRRRGGT